MTGLKKSSVFKHGGTMALDFKKQGVEFEMAMRSFGAFPIELLLPANGSESRGCDSDESDRRAIHKDAVLREPKDGCVFESPGTCGESKENSKADAGNGNPWNLSWPQYQSASHGAFGISVSVEKLFHRASESGVEH